MHFDTSEFEDDTKHQCPRCAAKGEDRSHDNFHWYSEEAGGFCYKCGFTIPSQEYLELSSGDGLKVDKTLVTQKDRDNLAEKALTDAQLQEIITNTESKPDKTYRGVSPEVWESLDIRWKVEDLGGTKKASMLIPTKIKIDGERRTVGFKVRELPKEFKYPHGYVGKLCEFINQCDAVADVLVICGGEIDLATMLQALKADKYRKNVNVVSSPLGESTTATMIKLHYDWVNAHKKIIVALDNDSAGDEAFEKVKAVIDNDKLYRANLNHKDINEYWSKGDFDKIIQDVYWGALPQKSYGIAGSGEIYDAIVKTVKTETIPLPSFLCDLKPYFKGGIPLQELVLLAAPSSVGKSAVVNEVILSWVMQSPHRILILSFEDTMGTFGAKIASRVSGHNILAMETAEEKLEVLGKYKDEINKYLYTDTGEHRFNIVDKIPEGIEELKETIVQSIKLYETKLILIDPVTQLLSNKTNEEQAAFMKFLESIKNTYGVTVLMSAHTRKGSSGEKDKGEGASYGEESIRGSSTLVGTATIVMLLSRDKMAEDPIERNTTKISISKSRTYSITGRDVAKIYYSPQHHTLFSYKYAEENGFFLNTSAEELKSILDGTKAEKVVSEDEIDNVEIIEEF